MMLPVKQGLPRLWGLWGRDRDAPRARPLFTAVCMHRSVEAYSRVPTGGLYGGVREPCLPPISGQLDPF